MTASPNVRWHDGALSREQREARLKQRGCVVWLTGLSGSGKSTLAHALEAALFERGQLPYVLDGDNVRHGLNGDLGFSPEDRAENIRRVAHVGALFADAALITLVSFISPYRADRDAARALVGEDRFLEVHVQASLETCEARDPKGLYARARAGELKGFTGVDAPYEAPEDPALVVETDESDVAACVERLLAALDARGLFL
jgi:adenylylsulfate kinase